MFKNPKASPLLHFSAHCDFSETSKKFEKKFGIFFSIFSFLRAFVVSSCIKSLRFRVFLSLRYGANLGRSRLVLLAKLEKIGHLLDRTSTFCVARYSKIVKNEVYLKFVRYIRIMGFEPTFVF